MKILQAFRLDQNLITKLKEEATEESRSLTKQVEYILKQHLKNKGAAEGKPATGTISENDLAGKRVDQDIIIEMFKRPKEEKRSIIQYLKKNGFIQEEVRGVGTCLIVPKDSDIKRLINNYEPIEDL